MTKEKPVFRLSLDIDLDGEICPICGKVALTKDFLNGLHVTSGHTISTRAIYGGYDASPVLSCTWAMNTVTP